MSFIIYFLAMYPAVMTRLRGETLDKIGSSRRPTYDDIRDMKYMRAVINGTIRPPSTSHPVLIFICLSRNNETVPYRVRVHPILLPPALTIFNRYYFDTARSICGM